MKTIKLQKEIQDDAIRFGNEANLARAIPYIRDGLKPSQRYVLYTALSHGYTSNKPHVKSLKLDGQVVGEAWPHGSEYQTIVRLSQDFVQNIKLLDMHGANGSQLGTPDAAASRYTEIRLSEACEEGLLKNLKKDVVDFIPNYSEDLLLPKLLPAILPTLYVNGSDGVAYCYSQTWLPGNLNEFTEQVKSYLKTKKIDYSNLAPDFPTKGIIINKKDLPDIYKTGKGSIILRGRAEVIGNDTIKITELPYQVYLTDYMQQLRSLITSNKLGGITNIYNMSGDGGIDLEIECDDDPYIVLQRLYKHSNLQINLAVNQYGIIDSIPELINLEQYIKVYINHNLTCLQREYKYDLDKAIARKEIVDGLIKAISIIDTVIATIKAAKSAEAAKQDLMTRFSFTENQVKAIIDMRLGKLANLEVVELNKELNELVKTIDYCNKFLDSDKLQKKEFLARLEAFTKKYGWERRTQVCDIDLVKEKQNIKIEKVEEDFTIILTTDNRLKKVSTNKLKKIDDNFIKAIEIKANDRFILISEQGKMYKLDAKRIDTCSINSAGVDISTLIDDKILNIYSGNEPEEYLVLVTKFGKLLKLDANAIWNLSKNIGAPLIKLQNEDTVIFNNVFTNNNFLEISTAKKTKKIKLDEILTKGRNSQGIQCILLGKKDPEIIAVK